MLHKARKLETSLEKSSFFLTKKSVINVPGGSIMVIKDNVRIEHGMFTSAIKKQRSVCCSISLNPYMVFQTWKFEYC